MYQPAYFQEISHAHRLLLAGLSMEPGLREGAFLQEVSLDDWQTLLDLAKQNSVASLLNYQLTHQVPKIEIPPKVSQEFQQAYHHNLRDNLLLLTQVAQMIQVLNDAGIPIIPLKGIYLADQVYPSPGVRRMGDVDLLVQRGQLAQAWQILKLQGYQAAYAFSFDEECQLMHHLPPLSHADGSVIELHWTLAPPNGPFQIPVEQLWARSTPIHLSGAPCRALSPEDLLLHLSLHAAYLEKFKLGLRMFSDIAWLLKIYAEQIDWPILAAHAEQWDAQRCTWLALHVARDLFQASCPTDALASLLPEDSNLNMVHWASMQVVNPSPVTGKMARVLAVDAPVQRAAVFARQLFPATSEIRTSYPRFARGLLWPLAYMQHLGIVIRRNWKVGWRLLHRNQAVQQEALQRQRINQLAAWMEGDKIASGGERVE